MIPDADTAMISTAPRTMSGQYVGQPIWAMPLNVTWR